MLYPLSYGGGPGSRLAHGVPGTDARAMAHAEIHHDRSIDAADLAALSGRTIAVLGAGNQGAAQAANLRDSGLTPLVGNREDSYATAARERVRSHYSWAVTAERLAEVYAQVATVRRPTRVVA